MLLLLLKILISLGSISLVYIIGFWLKLLKVRKKCRWAPVAPHFPILGSVFEFGSRTEIMDDITRLTNNPQKLCYLEILGSWNIMARDYEFMEFILTSNTILDKSSDYKYLTKWLGTGLLTAPGSKWKKRRRIITPAFHFSILEQFVDVFNANGDKLIKILYNEAVDKDSVDIYKYITACTLDIISESAMNMCVNTQENNNQNYVFAVKDMCRIAVTRALSAWLRYDCLFQFTSDYIKEKEYLKILHNFTNTIIDKRQKELQDQKTDQHELNNSIGGKRKLAFLDLLLSSTIDGKPLTREDIREEVDTFMFEGHDTTSSGIASALFLLANHQDVQQRVRDEQKEIYGKKKDAPATYKNLLDMKYLDLVIKETLRLYPPVPMIARNAHEDINYKGNIIPKDTIITLSIYGINRDPDYHPFPEEFRPERFMNDENSPFSYIPFSAGPRNCIGQKFAMLEMKSVISKIIRHFELCPTDPPHKVEFVSEAVMKSQNGIKIRLKNIID